jgi:hypothetical protein
MIHPEFFSDSHQAFKQFRKVTSIPRFLKSRGVVRSPWLWILFFTWLATIWIVHFFMPLSIVPILPLPKGQGFWAFCAFVGAFASLPFLAVCFWVDLQWKKRKLKHIGIEVKGWNWFGPKVQQFMLQEFTDYLTDSGFHNPEAISQLIENARDEIEARWRPIYVILTLVTVNIACIIAYYQILFSQWLGTAHPSNEDITLLINIGAPFILIMLAYNFLFYAFCFSYFRRERAIYLHCLSNIRLSLLKRCKRQDTKSGIAIDGAQSQVYKPAFFSLCCELRHPLCKKRRFIWACFVD